VHGLDPWGRYLDEFAPVDGRWLITHRREITDAQFARGYGWDPTGERLVERELAERLGTSLTATREALIQLETEGLITKKPNATTHVTQLKLEEVDQIFAVRLVLDRYAFEEAARVADAKKIGNIGEMHNTALEYAAAGNGIA